MRSPVVNDRVLAAKDSRVQRLLDAYNDNGKVVEELFVATIARRAGSRTRRRLRRRAREEPRRGGSERAVGAPQLVEFLYNF